MHILSVLVKCHNFTFGVEGVPGSLLDSAVSTDIIHIISGPLLDSAFSPNFIEGSFITAGLLFSSDVGEGTWVTTGSATKAGKAFGRLWFLFLYTVAPLDSAWASDTLQLLVGPCGHCYMAGRTE